MISLIYPDEPGSKGPETSKEAAEAVAPQAELLREQVLMLLQQHELTADEIADMLRKSILSVRPRCSELHMKNQIFDTTKRRKNASGNNAVVWTAHKPATV